MRDLRRWQEKPRTLNPENWEPPHLLVVEWVDWTDTGDTGFEAYVQCPYPLYEYTHHVDPEFTTYDRTGYTEYGHAAEHYCTMQMHMYTWKDRPPRPKAILRSWWHNPFNGKDETCARIEINGTAGAQRGSCMYHEVINNVGIQDALAHFRCWNNWKLGKIPKPDENLPDAPGEYPIYYWSYGQGEDYEDGLTLEKPERTYDFWEDDVPTRIFQTSSVPV